MPMRGVRRVRPVRRGALLGRLGAAAVLWSAVAAPGTALAATGGDITAAVLAGRDVTLSGDAVVRVPAGTHTYGGVISGQGTLRITGTGTLVLTRDSSFTLPKSRQRQRVTVQGGNHPYVTVGNPDPPAVTVDRGATLQYGTGGSTGLIGSFPYNSPGYQQNQDNIRVDGTLRLSLTRGFNLGIISGTGLVTQPRNMWGTLQLAGSNPFSGVIDNGTGTDFGSTTAAASLPNARKVLNQGSWIIDTPLYQTIVQRQVFYQREYGSDINVHSRPGSKVILTGWYSWSDGGGDTNPSLSDPSLNWRPVAHNVNKRGTNIEGADVQWGDGTTHRIFMPGTAQTVYINLHEKSGRRSKLTFDYDGPVTLGAPIGGGKYHDTLAAPGAGDVVVKGTRGNDVTFAAAQYYDGSTTVERGAVLRLGSGRAGGDGSLWTQGALYQVVDDGSLVVRNTRTAVTLPKVGGTGSVTQSGAAKLTLTGPGITYTGRTTVTRGTLAVTGGATLAHSSGVRLTSAASVLDLRGAGDARLRALSAAKGARLLVADGAELTVGGKRVRVTGGGRAVVGGTGFVVRGGVWTATGAVTAAASPSPSVSASPVRRSAVSSPVPPSPAPAGPRLAETGAAGSGMTPWQAVGAVAAATAAAMATYAVLRRGRGRVRAHARHRR